MLEALRRELTAEGLSEDVQVSTSGCLGLCDGGPMVVAYPDGTWYAGVTPEHVREIVAGHLRDGAPVSRLARADVVAMKSEMLEHGRQYVEAMRARDAAGVLPDQLNDMIRGFMSSRAVLTAIELDLFTAVDKGASVEQVAAGIHADDRATEMLLFVLAREYNSQHASSPRAACCGHVLAVGHSHESRE